MAEKHEQCLLIQRLRSQNENATEKLKRNINETTQDEIFQEGETLDRRREEKITGNSLLSVINKNKQIVFEVNQANQEIKKILTDLKQQLNRHGNDIRQQREETEHIKKTRWTNIQRKVQIHKAAVQEIEGVKAWWGTQMSQIQKQKQDLEIKLAQVQDEREEIERNQAKIRSAREDFERDRQLTQTEMDRIRKMRESAERQKQELDNMLQMTQKERRELEVMKTEIEIKKKHLLITTRMNKRKEAQINMMKREVECAKKGLMEVQWSKQLLEVNMEDTSNEHNQRPDSEEKIQHNQEDHMKMSTGSKFNTDMQGLIVELKEIRKTLHTVREDTQQQRKDITGEKSQIKWMNFQARKERRRLDQRLEKTTKERDELEILKIKVQRQREEMEQKLEGTIRTVLTMREMKTKIGMVSAEINKTTEEMLKTQRQIENHKEEIKEYMVSKSFL